MQAVSTRTKTLTASQVGFPCDRNLWYRANGYEEWIPPHTKRIFATGHVLESLVVKFLKEDGYTVIHNDKTHADAPDFVIKLKGGIITGRHDITFCPPGKNIEKDKLILGDIKTMNHRHYLEWKRHGTHKKYPQYIDQLTTYYHGLKEWAKTQFLNGKLAVIGFNKDNSDYHVEVFKYDPARWERIKERCERIFAMGEPPEVDPDKLPHWACSRCGFEHMCPCRIKKEPPAMETLENRDLETAAEWLWEARERKKEAQEDEKIAREMLLALKDREAVRVGKYIVKFTTVKQSRLDTKKLQKLIPQEIYNQCLKTVEYVKCEVKRIQEVV